MGVMPGSPALATAKMTPRAPAGGAWLITRTEAELQDAILYEAELWQADVTDTRLTGAHLAMTKLSGDRSTS